MVYFSDEIVNTEKRGILQGNDQYAGEDRDHYQARKQEALEEAELKQRYAEGEAKGMSQRAIRRKMNRKPRRKMKKL